jgi:hypothetical protein
LDKPITNGAGVVGPGYEYRMAWFGTPSATNDPLPDFLGYSGVVMLKGGIPGKPNLFHTGQPPGPHAVYWSYTPSSDWLSGAVPLFSNEGNVSTQPGLLKASGAFDRTTNTISGTLSDTDNGFAGTFRGQIFGPNRAELFVVFEFSLSRDGATFFGHYIGKR